MPQTEQNTVIIEGRVLNAVTGEPIRRVNLTLRPFGVAGSGGGVTFGIVPAQAPAPFSSTTDAEGKFRIEKVDPGPYRLSAERQGFVRQEYGARGKSMMGTTINIASGQSLKDLNFKLTPQAVIKGRVLDDEGEPIARVQVQLHRRRFIRGKQQLAPMNGTQTIDTGEFRIADISPGRYWISATHRGRMMFGEAPARNTSGKPDEAFIATYYPNATDEAGATPIDIVAGQELSGVDISLRKSPVYRIRGKVTGSALIGRGLQIFALPRDRLSMMGPFGSQSGPVKDDGAFEIAGVPPGTHYVAAAQAQGMMTINGKTQVNVGREDVENVNISIVPGMTVRGAIRRESTLQQQQPSPVFNSVRVQLTPTDDIAFNTPGMNAREDGTFQLENVGADRYRISVYNLPPDLWLKAIRVGDQDVMETGIDLSTGAPGELEIVVAAGVGTLSGLVRDAKQQPAPGSVVTLLPDPFKEGRNDLFKLSATDQNGQYNLKNIAPGEYRLYAWEDVEPGMYMDPEFLKTHITRSTKVTMKPAGQEQVNLNQVPADETSPKQ